MRPTVAFFVATAVVAGSAGAQAPGAPAAAASAPQARFTLTRVEFTPTVAVPSDTLQQTVAPWIGREAGAGELDALTAALRRLYEARGLGLVGIGIPSQDLAGGVLHVAVVEPRVTRVQIDPSDPQPVSEERTRRVLERNGVAAGQPLNLLAIDRAMYTLNDWPGVKAKATLTPSGDENAYSVAVQTSAARAWDFTVDADNHGTEVSGKHRVGAFVRWNNPGGVGDNADLRLVAAEGSGNLVGRLAYEVPVGASPWRAGVGYSRVNYELAGTFDGAIGRADVLDASLSHPILRSRDHNVIGRLSVERKSLHDEFLGIGELTSDKRIVNGQAQVSFESRDSLLGGGYTGGSIGLVIGRLRTGSAATADATAQGGFRKVTAQVTRLQALTPRWSLFTGMAGQWASQNLDNSEKLTLGGARGVRGYPAAEGASDQGAIFNAEVRWWINPQWSSFVFFDAAHGRLRKEPGTSPEDNTRSLHASGLGLQFSDPDLFTLKATLGVRGDEPVLSDTDNTGRSLLLVQLQRSF